MGPAERRELPKRLLELSGFLQRRGPLLLIDLTFIAVPLLRPSHLLLVFVFEVPQAILVALHSLQWKVGSPADPLVFHVRTCQELGIAPQKNVSSTASHIGRNGHRLKP